MTNHIKAILLLPAIIMFSWPSNAQKDTTIRLNEAIITASRIKSLKWESFKSTRIISKIEIENIPAQSVDDILKYSTGIDARQRGPFGVQTDISFNGGTFEQTLILLNGIKLSDPQTGHHSMNIPVNIPDIDQIEILKGPGARAFGQNAFCGAVNIITHPPGINEIFVSASTGSYGFSDFTTMISAPVGKYHQSLSFSSKQSIGYIENTDFNINNIFYQSGFNIKKTSIQLFTGYADKTFGANGFYTNLFPEQWEHVRTTFTGTNICFRGQWNPEMKIYWRENKDRYLLKRYQPEFYENNHTTDVFGFEFNFSYSTRFGLTSAGIESRKEQIISSNLGDHERIYTGFFCQQEFNYKKLYIYPGFFADWNLATSVSFFPGIDIGYQITKKLELFAGFERSYRVPTFTELYYHSPGNFGNPDLKPENASTFQGGIKRKGNYTNYAVSCFTRNSNDLIDWIRYSDTLPWNAMNIDHINTRGADLAFSILPAKLLQNNILTIYRFQIEYQLLDVESTGLNYLTKNVADFLKHQFIFSLDYSYFGIINQHWEIRYADRLGYDPVLLTDTKLSTSLKGIRFYVEISNLFDVKYYEFGNIEMPGRWIIGGISSEIRP